MRRNLIRAGIVAASLLAPLALQSPLAQTPAAAASAATQARVIVKFRAGSTLLRKQALASAGPQLLQAQALGQRIGIALTTGRGITDRSQVVFAQGMSSQQLAARIAAESDVEYAVADEKKHIVEGPTDSYYTTGPLVGPTSGGPAVGQWYLKPPGPAGTGIVPGTAPAAINAEQAWDISKGSTSIVVADLDTGLRFDHPDLQGNIIAGYDMVSPDDGASGSNFSSANDGNGRDADASDPGDGITQADKSNPIFANCTVSNSSWHGTQTAGLIGATANNGVGIAGIGRTVKLMPVRVLGKCGGYDSDIQAGMLWAAGIAVVGLPVNPTPARVLNMSLGGAQACSQGYIDAIGQVNVAGAVVVVAAGNSGGNAVGSPANCPGAIGVAGLRHVGDKVGYSDLGPEITIAAPAGNCVNTGTGAPCLYPIMTTTNVGTQAPVAGPAGAAYTDSFNASLGTSFSAPLVSGTVALMLSAQPSLTPAQVKTKLQSTARPFPTTGGTAGIAACSSSSTSQDECYCTTSTCGAGMLDAHAALLAVTGVQAAITLTTTTPIAGQSVALMSSSVVGAGQGIASYAWTILNAGTSGAAIVGANSGSTVTVTASAAGTFLIQLTTTDNAGFASTTTLSVVVAPATVVTPPASTPPAAASSGGGGALGVGWLLLLLSAVLALKATAPREPVRSTALSAADRPSRTG
jgi:serine protease